jgi:outer membrane lipoprotein LolB
VKGRAPKSTCLWWMWPGGFPALLGVLLLSACATRPPVPVSEEASAAFEAHRALVQTLDPWTLTGRLALDADGQQWHTNLRWRQSGEDFDIRLFGPFGRDAGHVQGDERKATLRAADGERFEADDVDRLVVEVLGWRLPVSGMRYWVMGLPAPEASYIPELDASGRLARLEQSGWTVQFHRYRNSPAPALPDRLELTYEDIRVRVLVDQWNVAP